MEKAVKVEKLSKSTFGKRISDKLRDAILNGEILPGTQIIETTLANQFGVSRGPLREAIRKLIDEGLLTQVPFKGTQVVDLSIATVQEIYSLRANLEIFAFNQLWADRGEKFATELSSRHAALTRAIDSGNEFECIERELELHSLVFETAGHKLLLEIWNGLRGKVQLYWASNHLAHDRRGPKRDSHESYVEVALGSDFHRLEKEIHDHMKRGAAKTMKFLESHYADPDSKNDDIIPHRTRSMP